MEEILLDNEFFTIKQIKEYKNKSLYKELKCFQHKSTEDTCKEIIRLYKEKNNKEK